MAKKALYQKYRSSTFEEVVGQEYTVRSIKNAIHEDKIGHAYLFCGPRGTGKTTMARLLAKSVNCENPEHAPCGECANCKAAIDGTHPDIVEINAANETHVEDIRELIDRSSLAPMLGKHKIYIIDEVHQLSSAASSALLKTLEEPPENVIFVLATTDPQKLLPTIISRCQRFDFTKVRFDQIQNHLLNIAEKEGIQMEPAAAEMIAQLSDGGMRDALSIMDQCASFTSDFITMDAIDQIYGLTTTEEKIKLLQNIISNDLVALLDQIDSYRKRGIDLQRYSDDLIQMVKEIIIYQKTAATSLLKYLDEETAKKLSEVITVSKGMYICNAFLDMKNKFKNASDVSLLFEMTCIAVALQDETVQIVKEVSPVQNENLTNSQIKPVQIPIPSFKAENTTENRVETQNEEKEEIIYQPVEPVLDTMSTDEIIGLLVQCNKTEKKITESQFSQLKQFDSFENKKYTSLLQSAKIVASGKDCIILQTSQVIARRINEKKMNQEIYVFFKDVMQIDKMVYAITESQFSEATNQFRKAYQEKSLPDPTPIQRYASVKTEQESTQDKIIAMFGEENVEIME